MVNNYMEPQVNQEPELEKKKTEPEPVTISEQSEGWRTSPSMYDAAMIQSAMTMSLLINNN